MPWIAGILASWAWLPSWVPVQREEGPDTGQQDPAEVEPQAESSTEGFFFEDEVELSLLLEICSDALDVHIERGAEELEGNLRVQLAPGYSATELWDLANRELVSRGLTTIQPPGSEALRVVPLSEAAGLARLERMDLAGSQAGFVKVIAHLDHAEASSVLETLEHFVSKPGGSVAEVRETNAIVLSDLDGHVRQALEMIALMDSAGDEPAIEEFVLEHSSPVAIGALIERVTTTRQQVAGEELSGSLLPLPEGGSVLVVAPPEEIGWWREMIERFDRPEPATTLHYTPRRFGLLDTAKLIEQVVGADPNAPRAWKVVVDQLTGTLIVTTTPSRHARVQDLLDRLESTSQGPSQPRRIFPIKHRQVSELLGLVQDLLEAGVLDQGGSSVESTPHATDIARGATGAIVRESSSPAVVGDREGATEVTITADEGTNRLIAFGEGRLLDQLGLLIESLDVRHAQVLVEALVVSLNESDTRDLGVELQRIGTSDGVFVQLSNLFGLGSPDPSQVAVPPATGTGFGAVVLDPGEFSAVVRALETLNEGRSLTIPKVLVNNNQQATLDSVLQTPFASVNASTNVATTSFGGTQDAGTSILVKPQVAAGDQIVLEYTVALSSFVGDAADPTLPPPRQETKLQSIVTVPDGYTVVVGGLEIESETDAESRTPFLGAIPILGNLFKNQSRTRSKSRFFVFLRCTTMRGERFEDLKYTSQPALAEAGVDDGWPKLEPRIIR